MISALESTTYPAQKVNDNLTIYPIVPVEAGLGWKLEFFELSCEIPPHYHKLQRQMLLVCDGSMNLSKGSKEAVLAGAELALVEPGDVHSIKAQERASFFAIDFPGFIFPDDVYYDTPIDVPTWKPLKEENLPALDPCYFRQKIDNGDYAAYVLVDGMSTKNKWSVALLEIQNSPKHYHKVEREIFIVVGGELDVEVDAAHHIVQVGESVVIEPGSVHQLKSHNGKPVRVLCFNFPAFDPADMYVVQ